MPQKYGVTFYEKVYNDATHDRHYKPFHKKKIDFWINMSFLTIKNNILFLSLVVCYEKALP